MKRGLFIVLFVVLLLFISGQQSCEPTISIGAPSCCEALKLDGSTQNCISGVSEEDCSVKYIGEDGYNFYNSECSSVSRCAGNIYCGYEGTIYNEGYTACSDNKLYQCVDGNFNLINNTCCFDSDGGANYFVKGAMTGIYTDNNSTRFDSWIDYCGSGGWEGYLTEYSCSPNNGYSGGVSEGTSGWTDFYKCPNGCKNGACIEISENKKDLTKYLDKEIFLISDKNWRDVLQLVPLTIWTDENGEIHKYPTLIYHEETSGFDADSIIYFMQQYSPQKITIIGDTPQELDNLLIAQPNLGVGLTINQIQRISVNNFNSYWEDYNKVVYVEDNYELALLASTYASLINAPLIIQGTSLDIASNFNFKNIICVGSVSPSIAICNEQYNLEQLQQKYINETNTDKMILVNSNDLNIKIEEEFPPERSSNPINELYGRTSLAAPILASSKHELLVSIIVNPSPGAKEVQSDCINQEILLNEIAYDTNLQLKGFYQSLFKPEYLTIIASPNAIPMSQCWDCINICQSRRSYDRFYASTNILDIKYFNFGFETAADGLEIPSPDIKIGRILGLTISDVSSNIARTIFYKLNDMSLLAYSQSDDMAFPQATMPGLIMTARNNNIEAYCYIPNLELNDISNNCNIYPPLIEEFKDKTFIYYDDHGSPHYAGLSQSELPNLKSSIGISQACSTNNYYRTSSSPLFYGSMFLRKGGIAYFGSAGVYAPSQAYSNRPLRLIFIGEDLGTVWKHNDDEDFNYILLGDPTLKPIISNYFIYPWISQEISYTSSPTVGNIIIFSIISSTKSKVPCSSELKEGKIIILNSENIIIESTNIDCSLLPSPPYDENIFICQSNFIFDEPGVYNVKFELYDNNKNIDTITISSLEVKM